MSSTVEAIGRYDVWIVAPNHLAGKYLAHVLASAKMKASLSDEGLPALHSHSKPLMFILDSSPSLLCLSPNLFQLQSRYPDARFIIVGNTDNPESNATFLRLGVQAIVDYRTVTTGLAEAVYAVEEGRLWVSEKILHNYVQSALRPKSEQANDRVFRITQREAQVIELAKLRLSNKEIADILGVRESTVKYHLSNIYGKLRVSNRRALDIDREQRARRVQMSFEKPGRRVA